MSTQRGEEKRQISPEEASELLPWYLTGRTSRAETEALDGLLRGSAELRTQLDAARQQRQAVADSTEAIGGPSAGNLTKLLQQIETTKQRRLVTAEEPGLFERLFGSWAAPRPVLRFALAAACVVIVAQGAMIYQSGKTPFAAKPADNASYATASAETVAETLGPELLVAFRPDVTAAQLTQILGELEAVVVDGPKPGLTFVLRLPATASADEAIARLQSRPDLVATAQRR